MDWLWASDWAQHLLGWLFFRNEPWGIPPGAIRGAAFPLGTSIGYTDSNPLMAMVVKLFSDRLPTDFQYIGPWLGLCFALQGMVGAKLVSMVARGRLTPLLGGLLFATAPVLMRRIGHDTLCAHFLILGAIGLNLARPSSAREARRLRLMGVGIVVVSALVHPYLAMMNLALGTALLWHHHSLRLLSRSALLITSGSALSATALIFFLSGYWGGGVDVGAWGLGDYSASPLTFFDSMGRSRWLPALPARPYQYEGFAYLGLGGVALLALSVLALARNWGNVRDGGIFPRPLRWVSLGLALFAVVPWFPPGIEGLLSPFRSSGRFIWPFCYLLLLATISILTELLATRMALASAVLCSVLLLQVLDARPELIRPEFLAKSLALPRAAAWDLADGYRHLAMYPMTVKDTCAPWDEPRVTRYAYRAYRSKLTYNSGYFARINRAALKRACGDLARDIEGQRLDPQTIYLVPRSEDVGLFLAAGATCGRVEADVATCVSSANDDPFRAWLTANPVSAQRPAPGP